MIIKLKNKHLRITCKKTNLFGRVRGLMFRRREKSPILLFNLKKPIAIHSFFVFFPFLALWLDNKNNVVEWKIVKPFSIHEKSKKHFSSIIEIPLSRRYHYLVKFIVGMPSAERFK